MTNRPFLHPATIFFLLTLLVAFLSWVGSIYGWHDVQSLLSAEGLRWQLRNAVPGFLQAPFLGHLLILAFGIGLWIHSGLEAFCFRLFMRHNRLSRKEKRAFGWSLAVGGVFLAGCIVLAWGPWSLVRSITGGLKHSPLADGCTYLVSLGLGIMGFADVLIKLKVPYNSDLGRKVMEYVLNIIKTASHERSKELVNDYGSVSERMQNPKRYISVQDEGDSHSIEKITKLLRTNKGLNEDHLLSTAANCACTCIAPTGSTSMIHNVSSGIEPYFALAFKRSLKGKLQDAVVMNKHLEAYLRENDLYNDDVINTIIEQGISAVEEIRPEVKSIYITAQKMKPEDHILMQVSAQKYIDNSISKTCNFPHNASIEYVSTIYEMANEGLCKGVTVYRDGCRDSQVFVSTEKKKGTEGTVRSAGTEGNGGTAESTETEGTKRSEWKDMKHSMSMDGCRSGSCDV